MKTTCAQISPNWWIALIVIVATVYPRLAGIGDFINMDEGLYAYQAMGIFNGITKSGTLPSHTTLNLYPLLLSWLCILPGKIIIWLRLADLCCAAVASWLFCLILLRENKKIFFALALAFIFLCAMNTKIVIDAGYKNSIFAAYVPLFGAFLLCSRDTASTSFRWCLSGALTAFAVLLREPLCIFAILGFVAVWMGWNYQAAWRYALGGIIAGGFILLVSCMVRGGFHGLLSAYISSVDVYAAQTGRLKNNLFFYAPLALHYFLGPVLLAIVGILAYFHPKNMTFFSAISRDCNSKKFFFWLACAFIPLIELAAKYGFVYHFAICLPGMAGLCAATLRLDSWRHGWGKAALLWCVLAIAGYMSLDSLPNPGKLERSFQVLVRAGAPDWPEDLVSKSNTLLAAEILKKITPLRGTVATNAFAYFLYPATGLLPPQYGYFDPKDSPRLSDLGRSFAAMGRDKDRLARAIAMNPPDSLAIAQHFMPHERDYFDEITDAIGKTGLYEPVAVVPWDSNKDYGWLGYTIYKKKGFH